VAKLTARATLKFDQASLDRLDKIAEAAQEATEAIQRLDELIKEWKPEATLVEIIDTAPIAITAGANRVIVNELKIDDLHSEMTINQQDETI